MNERTIIEKLRGELHATRKDLVHVTDRLCCDGTRTDHNAQPGDQPAQVIRDGAVCRGMLGLGEIKQRIEYMVRLVSGESE